MPENRFRKDLCCEVRKNMAQDRKEKRLMKSGTVKLTWGRKPLAVQDKKSKSLAPWLA